MPSYNVTVELLIEAESKDRAWEISHALATRGAIMSPCLTCNVRHDHHEPCD